MQFLESVILALEAIWANKLRSLLTVLGNIVAVTSIITVVSLIQGMNGYVTNAIVSDLGADSFNVTGSNAEHLIADAKIRDAFADRADHAGKIPPQHIGELRLAIVADAHLPIGAVDAGGVDVDDHLARCGDRVGEIAILQDFRPAVAFNECSLHRTISAPRYERP
jgi:hypothetical protein